MSLVQTKLLSGFHDFLKLADPQMEDYFLMGSPLPITTILVFYILFVFKIGPNLMKNRPALKLDKILLFYNGFQILCNGIIFIASLRELPYVSLFCTPLAVANTPHAKRMINLQYGYTMLKIVDLLDTIFFILRKKNNQVTFLHVYHHLLMTIFPWICAKFFAGGQVYFLGSVNLFVHCVMYFYYFLTAWNPVYKESIWWKKYITQLQICQHCFVFVAFAIPFFNPNCGYPKLLLGLYLTQAVLMIYLFVNFYRKTYLRKKPEHNKK